MVLQITAAGSGSLLLVGGLFSSQVASLPCFDAGISNIQCMFFPFPSQVLGHLYSHSESVKQLALVDDLGRLLSVSACILLITPRAPFCVCYTLVSSCHSE